MIPAEYAMRRRMMASGGGFTLADLPQGAELYLAENGVNQVFIVAKQGYPATGRTLLLRKLLHSTQRWHTSNKNAYPTSSIDTWLNNTYLALFSAAIQAQIANVDIEVVPGNGDYIVTTIARKVFLLSLKEAGLGSCMIAPYTSTEGSDLGLFTSNQSRIAYLGATATNWWLRSVRTNMSYHVVVVSINGDAGAFEAGYSSSGIGVRPAFTLPGTLLVNPTPDGSGVYSLL